MTVNRLDPENSALLLIDLQARLLPAIERADNVLGRAQLLLDGAERLGIPIIATEHYAAGIGPTVEALRDRLDEAMILEKIHFAAGDEPGCLAAIRKLGRHQLLLAGSEAHVCVMQTAMSLIAEGFTVFIAIDATGSRRAGDKQAALDRLAAAGAVMVTAEMALFEWLRKGDHPAFKELLARIKA